MTLNNDSPDGGGFAITMRDTPAKPADLKSSVSTPYYNSMDYTNHNFLDCKGEADSEKAAEPHPGQEIRTFKRRFIMLFLASFCSMMNGFPQFQYTVVADIVSCYYGASITAVDWTCMAIMAVFIPFVFPVMYFMDKKGLRCAVMGGAFLNALAAWIQCASFAPNRFAVIMVSQITYGLGQVFLLSLPPFIAGVWFGPGEVGLACAFGVFGNQLGVAAGFIIPPLVLDNNCTHQTDISFELSFIAYPIAAVNTVVFIVIIIAFQEKPRLFPSIAQSIKQNAEPPNYTQSLKRFFKDIPFMLLFVAYGLITGTYYAMSTIMNQMVLVHFEGAEVAAGWMGAIMVFTGMIGSLVLGAILDRTRLFKMISVATFGISFALLVAYSILITYDTELWVQYLFFALLGFFLTGYLPIGFDFAAEITYPESEVLSGSLLNTACQIFSIGISVAAGKLIEHYGDLASNIFLCACMLVGTVVTACIKCELKRTLADQRKKQDAKNYT